jgi:hypothetical protein
VSTPLADRTFLGWRADTWSAFGVWMTIVVYVALAWFAYKQLKEARRLRIEQTRPFVIVDVAFRSVLIQLSVRNIGRTAAKDLSVGFDESLTSSLGDLDWQHSVAFTSGIPLMAPGRELRFLLDSYPGRLDESHPMLIRGSVTYSGPVDHKRPRYCEPFVIDLSTYEGALLPDKGTQELVDEVENVRKELAKWPTGHAEESG